MTLQYKIKHSRGDVIKKHALTFLISEYNWLHFTTSEGRGNVHANTAASINTKKTGLHPTTDSAHRPMVLLVVNIFHSSTNGTDCCCAITINIEVDSRCHEAGRKRRPSTTTTLGRKRRPPTTVHVRESDKGQHSQHEKTPMLQKKKIFPTRLRAESSNLQTTF